VAVIGEAVAAVVAAAAFIGSFLAPSQSLRKTARKTEWFLAKAAVVVLIAAFISSLPL
jgi:hypothetical protein